MNTAIVTETTRPDIYVQETGSRGSPAVLFLHGVGNSGAMWKRHMAQLEGFHCLAPDLPGFGRSNSLLWTSRIDITDQMASLIRTRVPEGRAHVIGLSLGGSIAHTLLARHHDVLDRVVIDGCAALPWRGTRLLVAGVGLVSPVLRTKAMSAVVGRSFGLDEAAREDMRAASPRAFRSAFADANTIRISAAEVEATCPALLVAGEREMKPPVRASNAALAELMPNAEARFAPGHGHGWLGKDAELHIRMVNAWLTSQPLPTELAAETTQWDRGLVEQLIAR